MAYPTVLEVANEIADLLREDTITSFDVDDYAKTVLAYMSRVRRDIERAFYWSGYRETMTWSQATPTGSSTVVNTSRRSFVIDKPGPTAAYNRAQIWDVTDPNNPTVLIRKTLEELLKMQIENPNQSDDGPSWFAEEPVAGGLAIHYWPYEPTTQIDFRARMFNPDEDWVAGTDEGTAVKIPKEPLILGSMRWLLAERGEEFGVSPESMRQDYMDALAEAVQDEERTGDVQAQTDEIVWSC